MEGKGLAGSFHHVNDVNVKGGLGLNECILHGTVYIFSYCIMVLYKSEMFMFIYIVHVATVAICCEVIWLFGGHPDHCFSQSQGVQWIQSILVQWFSGGALRSL